MNEEPNSFPCKKQEYEVPRLVKISLRAEEAVLGHCKIGNSAGPVTSNCAVLHCRSIGS